MVTGHKVSAATLVSNSLLESAGYKVHNVFNTTAASRPELVAGLHSLLLQWYLCEGSSCF